MKTSNRNRQHLRGACAAIALASFLVAAPARGQTTLYTFNGDSAGDFFGRSVSGAGDVNGDGYADLIVGAQLDDNNGDDSGSARVFSGLDGSILVTFNGDSAGDRFGRSVSVGGDVNADGFDDLIVGAYLDDNNGTDSGSARVISPTPIVLVINLSAAVVELGFGQRIETSLDGKLNAALAVMDDLNTNDDVAAISLLQAFINAVEAQRGTQISEGEADALINDALLIIGLLGGA